MGRKEVLPSRHLVGRASDNDGDNLRNDDHNDDDDDDEGGSNFDSGEATLPQPPLSPEPKAEPEPEAPETEAEEQEEPELEEAEPEEAEEPRKRYQCQFCPYACDRNCDMKDHERIHTGDKPHKCSYCSYSCIRAFDLNVHEMRHKGEKPFKCSQCDYSCRRLFYLKTHERVHTGERINCDYCDFTCVSRGDMNRHVKKHLGIVHRCPHCVYTCVRKFEMKRHLRAHFSGKQRGKKHLVCRFCPLGYSRAGYLKKHERMHLENPETFKIYGGNIKLDLEMATPLDIAAGVGRVGGVGRKKNKKTPLLLSEKDFEEDEDDDEEDSFADDVADRGDIRRDNADRDVDEEAAEEDDERLDRDSAIVESQRGDGDDDVTFREDRDDAVVASSAAQFLLTDSNYSGLASSAPQTSAETAGNFDRDSSAAAAAETGDDDVSSQQRRENCESECTIVAEQRKKKSLEDDDDHDGLYHQFQNETWADLVLKPVRKCKTKSQRPMNPEQFFRAILSFREPSSADVVVKRKKTKKELKNLKKGLVCRFCPSRYRRVGYLKKHESTHLQNPGALFERKNVSGDDNDDSSSAAANDVVYLGDDCVDDDDVDRDVDEDEEEDQEEEEEEEED